MTVVTRASSTVLCIKYRHAMGRQQLPATVYQIAAASNSGIISSNPATICLGGSSTVYVTCVGTSNVQHLHCRLTGWQQLQGLVHITGGGFPENIPRVFPDGIGCRIDRSSWQVPDLFQWVQQVTCFPLLNMSHKGRSHYGFRIVQVICDHRGLFLRPSKLFALDKLKKIPLMACKSM